MALARRDVIDEKLRKMYLNKVTVNVNNDEKIKPEDFWNQMQIVASSNKAYMNFRLRSEG